MAKSISDKTDMSCLILPVKDFELKALETVLAQGCPTPTHSLTVYKNRRGEHKSARVWMVANLGICQFETVFCTDADFNLIDIERTVIKTQKPAEPEPERKNLLVPEVPEAVKANPNELIF